MSHRITCITKPDRENTHEAISHVGGIDSAGSRFYITREQTYDYIKTGHSFHVVVDRYDIPVIAYEKNGYGKYIRTKPDSTLKDNLLSLQSCQ